MAQKINEEDLMSFEDFDNLSSKEQKKVVGRSRIIAIERLKNSANFKRSAEVRKDLVEFANEEILPLITDLKGAKAKEKAFFIALKIFRIHDIRLQSALTLEEVAIIMGITRERIRQIESKASMKLKHPKVSRFLSQYVNLGDTAETVGF